eukprot:TRINITY_DN3690_c0_g1_i2.p1 TRINITY_DN3690_c0_g1~~TRINITY_DN3690_c0_g1_i2.p1  ORF type:complete len:954 (+),score=131.83 TRINITY_DN3690_c0_g1_i2:1-2862(+)
MYRMRRRRTKLSLRPRNRKIRRQIKRRLMYRMRQRRTKQSLRPRNRRIRMEIKRILMYRMRRRRTKLSLRPRNRKIRRQIKRRLMYRMRQRRTKQSLRPRNRRIRMEIKRILMYRMRRRSTTLSLRPRTRKIQREIKRRLMYRVQQRRTKRSLRPRNRKIRRQIKRILMYRVRQRRTKLSLRPRNRKIRRQINGRPEKMKRFTYRQLVKGSTPTGEIQMGSQHVNMSVILDTGSDKLLVKTWDTVLHELDKVDQGASSLVTPSSTKIYNHFVSKTYKMTKMAGKKGDAKSPQQKQGYIVYGSGIAYTDEGTELVTLDQDKQVEHFPISEVTSDSLQVLHGNNISGILGLQHMRNRSLGESLFSRFRDAGGMTAFGYCRGRNNDGAFIWGDDSKEGTGHVVEGQMHWTLKISNVTFPGLKVTDEPEESSSPFTFGDAKEDDVSGDDADVTRGKHHGRAKKSAKRRSSKKEAVSSDTDSDEAAKSQRDDSHKDAAKVDDSGSRAESVHSPDGYGDVVSSFDSGEESSPSFLEMGSHHKHQKGSRSLQTAIDELHAAVAKHPKSKSANMRKHLKKLRGAVDSFKSHAHERKPDDTHSKASDILRHVNDIQIVVAPDALGGEAIQGLDFKNPLKDIIDRIEVISKHIRRGPHAHKEKAEKSDKRDTPKLFHTCGKDQDCIAVIDTGSNIIAMPSEEVRQLTTALNLSEDCSNMDTLPDLHFTLGGKQKIVLPPAAYVMKVQMPGYDDSNATEDEGTVSSGFGTGAESKRSLEKNPKGHANLLEDSRDGSSAESQRRKNLLIQRVKRDHGLDLQMMIDIKGKDFDLRHARSRCILALFSMDRTTQLGQLYVIGGPLFENYYTKWSWPENATKPMIHLKELDSAKVCQNERKLQKPVDMVVLSKSSNIMRSESASKRATSPHSAEVPDAAGLHQRTVEPREIDLQDIRFPHWARHADTL